MTAWKIPNLEILILGESDIKQYIYIYTRLCKISHLGLYMGHVDVIQNYNYNV